MSENSHADTIRQSIYHGEMGDKARQALDALLDENQRLEAEIIEWKAEAERSKWPKESAQELFKLRAENQRLRDTLERIAHPWTAKTAVLRELAREALAGDAE